MMDLDFQTVEEHEDYASVPPGEYRVRIIETRQGLTRDGKAMWGLRLDVTEGEFAGRLAAWDNLVFSERGLPRVKLVLEALGFDVSSPLQLERKMLVGLEARVDLLHEEYENPRNGRRQARNVVRYGGWYPPEGSGGGAAEVDPPGADLSDLVAEAGADPF